MSRDRSATIRFSRRAENFKSFSIAISTQSSYFHSINCPMALYGAIETLHRTEQNRTYPSRNILRDGHLKVNHFNEAYVAAGRVKKRNFAGKRSLDSNI